MSDLLSVPLIWTIHGNLPVDSLDYRCQWEEAPDGAWTKLIERYYRGDELVRESAHVLHRRGLTAEAVLAPSPRMN